MNDPAEADEPEGCGEYEVKEGGEQAALYELAKAGYEETTEGCYDVAARSLS